MPLESPAVWPLLLYGGVVITMVLAIVGISFVLGERHRERTTDLPYESGMALTGSARLRFTSGFYLIAMFFVIFDLESVFVFAWALAARELRWAGYAEFLIFVGVLVAGLVYLWRSGALDWSASGHARARAVQQKEAPHDPVAS